MKRKLRAMLRQWGMIASVIASAIVLGVWLRSYAVGDRYRWVSSGDTVEGFRYSAGGIVTGAGGVALFYEVAETDNPARAERLRQGLNYTGRLTDRGYRTISEPRYPIGYSADDSVLNSLGIYFRSLSQRDGRLRRGFTLTLPFWSLMLVTVAYPLGRYVAGVLRRQREDRVALGLCPRCGVPIRDPLKRCPGCDLPAASLREVQV